MIMLSNHSNRFQISCANMKQVNSMVQPTAGVGCNLVADYLSEAPLYVEDKR